MEDESDSKRDPAPYDNDEVRSILGRSSVGLAGAGGLGSNIAMALARSGVGHLIIVDFDVVEESNLNRQYFFLDQVGRPKVEALKENIERAVSTCDVDIINRKLETGSMADPFKDVDIIVEALDKASTKISFIEESLIGHPDKPVVAASGVAGIGGSDRIKESRYDNLHLVEDPDAFSSDDDVLLSPRVGLFAHYQANIVLELLVGGK